MMGLMTVGLMLGGLAILWFTSRGWRGSRRVDLGWMSQQWLAEHRAGSR
jgi:hypothetical protein